MPELLDEIMDEIAVLMGEITVIRRQVKRGEKITEAQLTRVRRHATRIVSTLQAVEVEN
jgi:flagella basal body P-ring formation protein FlgA